MRKILIYYLLFTIALLAENFLKNLQDNGIIVTKEGKSIHVKRQKNKLCTKEYLAPEPLFGSKYAGEDVPTVCKKSFVTHVGVIQPMHLIEGVKTVGEVEVLEHIKASEKEPSKYLLIDARAKQWFNQMTIPTAVNVPFNKINYDVDLEEDDFKTHKEFQEYQKNYKEIFKLFGIKETKEGLDFSKAKTLLLFCNGSWCSQSPNAIMSLVNIGYPTKKLLWYRGGMQDWLIYNFTVSKREIKDID